MTIHYKSAGAVRKPTEASAGNKATAQRMINAEENFLAILMDFGGLDYPSAQKALAAFRKAQMVRMDAVGGRITVKHGSYLNREVIRRAAEQ